MSYIYKLTTTDIIGIVLIGIYTFFFYPIFNNFMIYLLSLIVIVGLWYIIEKALRKKEGV